MRDKKMKRVFSNVNLASLLLILVTLATLIGILVIMPSINYAHADSVKCDSAEKHYFSAQNIQTRSTSQESIEYTSYNVLVDSEVATPLYYNTNASLLNVCGAVAGANIIGYYDSKYTNLIPSYDPEIIRGNRKVFKSVSSDTQNVINDLYVRMNTNTTGAGVTHNQFQNGLMSYISAAGYSATVGEAVSSGQINVNTIKNNIENGIPMICFCTMSYYVNNINIGSNVATLTKVDYQANHIMIVNGIKQVAYFQNGENFRTDTYLKVAMGLQDKTSAYILLSSIVLDNMNTLAIN